MSSPSNRWGSGVRRVNPRRGRSGFTFIELIIAMVLLSVVMTLLYTSFSQVSNSVKGLTRQLTDQQEMRLLLKMITDDLQAARYFEQFVKLHEGQSGIKAKTDRLEKNEFSDIRFHSAINTRFFRRVSPDADPNMHEIAYSVRIGGDLQTHQLVRREDFYLDDDMSEGGITTVLAEGLEAFQVEFLPRGAAGSIVEKWKVDWDSSDATAKDRMPAAIRVTLATKAPGGVEIREIQEFNLVTSGASK